jgi:predicted thioredoxin/glutaredoxin
MIGTRNKSTSRVRVKVTYDGKVLYSDMLTREEMNKLVDGLKKKGYDIDVTYVEG